VRAAEALYSPVETGVRPVASIEAWCSTNRNKRMDREKGSDWEEQKTDAFK
jgi:hypothetical protein